ncbi:MAG TPA: stalk domain-containing protein [Bacillota bacterium]|nr:stalk domain-containing protein [Bacillota bacterium]
MRIGRNILPSLRPLFLAGLFFLGTGQVYAQTQTLQESPISLTVNNQPLSFEHQPMIKNNSTLVPLRAIFEALGAQVDWDSSTQTVTAKKDNTTIQITIGKEVAYKNKQEMPLLAPGMIVDGVTMVPTRFVAESLGANVNWDPTARSISVNLPKSQNENYITHTEIQGDSVKKPEELYAFAAKYNPQFPKELADLYITIGQEYHIRGDIAFMQMCKETNFFRFGGDVLPGQNNMAGIGATGGGQKGNQFSSLKDGVSAHIQHLYAYATKAPIPKSEPLLDPRFQYVKRGIASTWEQLGGKWAVSNHYGEEIVSLYHKMDNSVKMS